MSAIDFSDDPRAVLIHFNEKHDHLGRFAKKSGGVSATPAKSIDSKKILDDVKSAWSSGKENQGVDLMIKDGYHISSTKRDALKNNMVYALASAEVSPLDAQKEVVKSLITDRMIDDTPDLKNLIGYDKYHDSSDYANAARKIVYESESILNDALRDFGFVGAINDIYSGDQEKYRLEVIDMVCDKLDERMKNQPFASNGKSSNKTIDRPSNREKEVSGSASITRRAMNAEQAYKLASEQRHKDIQKKQEADGAADAYAKASEQRRKDLEKKLKHVDYTDDPRAVLVHKGGGNPYHDPKTGQFTTGTGFGMGRYVDKDGNLTAQGQKRLANALKKNARKKKDDRVKPPDGMTVVDVLTDPHQWVTDDLTGIETSLKSASSMASDVERFIKNREAKRPLVRKKNLKLDDMTDAELQAKINRYMLEQRYQDTFNPKEPPEVSKGKKFLMNTLEVAGSALAIGASAVTIAKAIHEMKKD